MANKYISAYIVTFSIGVVGLLMMYISTLLGQQHQYAKLVYDIGMILGPIGFIGVIYEVAMRAEFIAQIRQFTNHDDEMNIIFADERMKAIEEIIDSAKDELIIMGNAPFYPYANKSNMLSNKLANIASIKILSLNIDSKYIKTREAQSGNTNDLKLELTLSKNAISKVISNKNDIAERIEYLEYSLPPAEFLFAADKKMLLATWYPYGLDNEEAPCILIKDSTASNRTRRIASHFFKSFYFVWNHGDTQRIEF